MRWLAIAVAVALWPGVASAYKYQARLDFQGTYQVTTHAADGTVSYQMTAQATIRGSWPLVIAANAGRVISFPGAGHVHITLKASGFRSECGQQQAFSDVLATPPQLSWMSVSGTGSQIPVRYQWSGVRIDRVWQPVASADGSCTEPGGREAGTGIEDLPGTVAQAQSLRLPLHVPASAFFADGSANVTMHLHRAFPHGRTTRTLVGVWGVSFTPTG
jgi:hypothetical protein